MVGGYREEGRPYVRNRSCTVSLSISDLNDKRFSVRNPISIIVEEDDDEAWARWPEVNAYGLGSTLYDAIRDIKQNIVREFLNLSDQNEGFLGELAVETLDTLRAYINENQMPDTDERGRREKEDTLVASLVIRDLSDERIVVRNPISIIVEEDDDDAWARWPEVNACGTGTGLYDAILDLKQDIVKRFLDLSERDEGELGELDVEMLSTLRAYIYKKEKMPCPEWELGDEIKGKGILDLDDILREAICRSIWRLRCNRCAQSIMTNAERMDKTEFFDLTKNEGWRAFADNSILCGRCAKEIFNGE